MRKHFRKKRWALSLIILSLLVFATVLLAQKWAQTTQSTTVENLNGVWIAATKNSDNTLAPYLKIYAVGDAGTIIYSENGTEWTAQTSGIDDNLNAVWGSSSTDIFAVGNSGTILNSTNGTDWSGQTSGTDDNLNAIWGSSSTNIFAVGDSGTILHSTNGTDWTGQTSGALNLYAVWGSAANNIFAVGQTGRILHSTNGTSWTAQTSGTSYDLNAVWGSSSANVYAVGANGTILHYDGTTWTSQSVGSTVTLKGIWGTSFCNIYAVGATGSGGPAIYHFNGSTWASQDAGVSVDALNAVDGVSIRDIYAVGANGFVMKFDPEDAKYPTVYSSRPGLYDSDIPLTTTASATFNAEMDPDSFAGNFTLVYYENQEAQQVPGTISYSNNTLTFTPSSPLGTAVTYTATLRAPDSQKGFTGVTDTLGVPISADFSWSFTPGSDPDTGNDSGTGCFITTAHPAG